jgi:hypothetical protein
MNKLPVHKIQMFSLILALITPSIACKLLTTDVEAIYDAAVEECFPVSRSEYESTAAQLGQTPKTPKYPESTVYEVCYVDMELSSVRMSDGYRSEDTEQTESEEPNSIPSSTGADESISIPAGTYIGEPAIPAIWSAQQDFANFSIDENTITIIVEEDGTTHGEKILIYSYTATGIEDAPIYITNEWIITFEGTLHGTPYKLRGIASSHFVLTGPGTDNPIDNTDTLEGSYDIHISENIMSGSPTNEADFEIHDDLDMYTFEATKQ